MNTDPQFIGKRISHLLTNKSHHTTGKNNIKPLITRMNTDMKKWARVHSLREWGRVKQKLCKQACKIFAFFCQSQLDGIIRAHLRNPWLVLLQPRPACGLLKTDKTINHKFFSVSSITLIAFSFLIDRSMRFSIPKVKIA